MTAGLHVEPRSNLRVDRPTGLRLIGVATLVGLLVRVPLVHRSGRSLSSDEAFSGLIARELVHGRLLWIFPGQHYQGTLEAFVVAALSPLFGPSAPLLRWVSAAFWLAAALLLDLAARRIAGTRPGVVFTLVWLWSCAMVLLSTTALVGYGSALLACAFGYWAWGRALVPPQRPGVEVESSRWLVASGLGFGIAFWQQPTFLGTAIAFGVGCLLFPKLRPAIGTVRRAGAMAIGMAAGASPLILYNAANDWRGLSSPEPSKSSTYLGRVEAIVTGLLPRGVGARLADGRWTLGVALGLVTLALMLLAYGVAVGQRHRWPLLRPVLLVAPITVVVNATYANGWYVTDARYSTSFVPALAVIFATALRRAGRAAGRWLTPVALAGLAATGLVVPLVRQHNVNSERPDTDVAVLVDHLQAMGFRCAIGDYWSTHRLDYLAGGAIHASADGPYPIRLPQLYDAITAQTGRFVRLAPIGSAMDQRYQAETDRGAGAGTGGGWRRTEVADLAVYVPVDPAPAVDGALC